MRFQFVIKHKIAFLLIVFSLCVAISIFLSAPIEDFVAQREVSREVYDELDIIIDKYGLEDVEVNIEFPEWSDSAYSIHLTAAMPDSKGLEACIAEINRIEATNEKRWWRTVGDVVINGKNYDPSYNHLVCDCDGDYIVAEIPYYGMAAEDINHTELGRYDDMELCWSYYELDYDHQSITYYWYDNEGNEIFSARTLADKVISIVDRRGGALRVEAPGLSQKK